MSTTMNETNDSDRLNHADKAWLEFANGTYDERDKRIFIAGFYKGESYRARRERQREKVREANRGRQ